MRNNCITDSEYISYVPRYINTSTTNTNTNTKQLLAPVDVVATSFHIILLYNEPNHPHLVIAKIPPNVCLSAPNDKGIKHSNITHEHVVYEHKFDLEDKEKFLGLSRDESLSSTTIIYSTHSIYRLEVTNEPKGIYTVFMDRALNYKKVKEICNTKKLSEQETRSRLIAENCDFFFLKAFNYTIGVRNFDYFIHVLYTMCFQQYIFCYFFSPIIGITSKN